MPEPGDTIEEMDLDELRGTPNEYYPPAPPRLTRQLIRTVVADLIAEPINYRIIARRRHILLEQVILIEQMRRDRIHNLNPHELTGTREVVEETRGV